MNVLILGKSSFNCQIKDYIELNGYHPIVVEDVDSVRNFTGQAGDFTLTLKDNETHCVGFVIFTEQPRANRCDINGGTVYTIYDEGKVNRLSAKDRLSPIVFLLDYCHESPMASTIKALTDAKDLAGKKRQVYYLNRFVRTGGKNIEVLYKEARNAGVTFIKYEDLQITYDDDLGSFQLEVNDGAIDIAINSKDIYGDGCFKTDGPFALGAKKLRLRSDENGFIVEDQFYLTPVLTSRKGIYHINRDIGYEKLEEGLQYILASAGTVNLSSANTAQTAVVNGEKCVLCYSCYRACPHGAMEPNKEARLMENLPIACEGCGICVSVCPGNAIKLEDEKAKAPLAPKSGKTLLLCCENSAEIACKKVLPSLGTLGAKVEVEPVHCGGSIGLEQIGSALLTYDKVMVAVCMDRACRHFDGNKRACHQVDRILEMLDQAGMPKDRVGYTQVSHAMPKVFGDALMGFIKGGNQ